MTDISRMAHVVPARTQLPVKAYFDEVCFACEQEFIFKQSSLYVGHQKLVPNSGDWRTLAHEEAGRVLVRNQQGVELISNVCRHRQAIMLGGAAGNVAGQVNNHGNLRDTGGNVVCPLHRWTYNERGQLLGAPQFDKTPCLNLERFRLRNCHGLLFEGPRDPGSDMANLFARPRLRFWRLRIGSCRSSPVQLQLEDIHRGLP